MEIYIEPHQPRLRLVIIGGQHVAQALVHLGRAMGYETVSVVPEGEANQIVGADRQIGDLEALPGLLGPSAYVVVATHGNYDELALEPALESGAGYIGLVASRKRSESVVEYLRGKGFGEEDLARLQVPAGLDIGARRGDEIALSILAEIVQHRRQEDRQVQEEAPAIEDERPESATDPICGMAVKIDGAAFTHEHEGVTYYFCCAGCQTRFATNPEIFIPAAP